MLNWNEWHETMEDLVRTGLAFAFIDDDGDLRYRASIYLTEEMIPRMIPFDELVEMHREMRLQANALEN